MKVRRPGLDILGRRRTRHPDQHHILDEMILDQLPSREWISSTELYIAVVGSYGTVGVRVFYRHMAWLRESGAVLFRGRIRQYSYRKPVSPTK